MMEKQLITILLSTFNGEKFLREQIDSVLSQSFRGWQMIVRDDGSSDKTKEILRDYASKFPQQIFIDDSVKENLGPKKSFSLLMKRAASPYIAFCDQDDFWFPHKLTQLLKTLQDAEKITGGNYPIAVFSDLQVVNEERKIIADSFLAFSGIKAVYAQNNTLLCRNVAPGCSMLINKALLEMAGDVPEEAVMHDYWLMLMARFKGMILFVPESLLQYRQHGSNNLGADAATKTPWKKILRNFGWYLKGADFYPDRFTPYRLQAEAMAARFSAGDADINAVRAFAQLKAGGKRLNRKWALLRFRLRAGNFRDNIELFLCG